MKYKNATDFTRTCDKFQYHVEDVLCRYCANFRKRVGCGREVCEFEDIKRDAVANGRIARKRGYFSCRG